MKIGYFALSCALISVANCVAMLRITRPPMHLNKLQLSQPPSALSKRLFFNKPKDPQYVAQIARLERKLLRDITQIEKPQEQINYIMQCERLLTHFANGGNPLNLTCNSSGSYTIPTFKTALEGNKEELQKIYTALMSATIKHFNEAEK